MYLLKYVVQESNRALVNHQVNDSQFLTLEDREEIGMTNSIEVETIPVAEDNGKSPILYYNPETQELWYEYMDTPKTEIETLRDEFAKYRTDQDLLLMQILLGGSPI